MSNTFFVRKKFSAYPQQAGSNIVEFALTLPLLLVLIAGVFDLGWAIYAKNTMADAAREGARAGIIASNNDATIRARVRAAAQGLNLTDAQIVINPSPARSHFAPISVTVNYTYTSITTLIVGGVNLPMSSQATMVVE